MLFTVQELRSDWHEVGCPDAPCDGEAVEEVGRLAGMYRARAFGSRIWHYFWVGRDGAVEDMDGR